VTLPTLQVLLDNGTGTFPFDITTKVLSLDGYDLSRGRADWIGAVTAGVLNLTLNNSDGRFTPGSTILATPSPITVDQQIRLVVTGVGVSGFGLGGFGLGGFGTGGYGQFTGYVKSWPVSWPAVVPTFAEVQLTAVDAQAKAERHPLRSMLEEQILLTSPSAYYTLAEAEGSTSAGDTSGNQSASLTIASTGAAMTFGSGIGPGSDGLTAAMFANGQYLGDATAGFGTPAGSFAMGCWFATSTMPAATAWLVHNDGAGISITGPGGTLAATGPMGSLFGATNVVDGLTHFVALTSDGTTARLWLDGVQIASSAVAVADTSLYRSVGGNPLSLTAGLTGTISHVGIWPTLAGADVLAIYQAGAAIESSTSRITRLAGYAGIPVGTLDASLTTVGPQSTSGKSAWDAIQEVVDAEFGLAFIDGSGSLVFHNRNRVASKSVPDLTLDRQWVTPDVAPVVDDQQLINYSEVTASGTGATQLVRDTISEDGDGTATHPAHGRYPDSRTYLVQTDAEALDRANWIISNFGQPSPRYGTLTINLYGMTQAQAATVMNALDMSCWLRVTSMNSQNPGGTTADVVIQGWNVQVTAESWAITCNVVARSLYAALILDDATYGVLDSTSKLYF
jgi:hypothetical protein